MMTFCDFARAHRSEVYPYVDGREVHFAVATDDASLDRFGDVAHPPYPYRIPADGDTIPKPNDRPIGYPTELVSAIGFSGWDYAAGMTEACGFDFDRGHGPKGQDEAGIARIIELVSKLDYVQISRSKSGKGIHLWVRLLRPFPASNRAAHLCNCDTILAQISHDVGVDLELMCCAHGGIMYEWSRNPGPGGFEILKPATAKLEMEAPTVEMPTVEMPTVEMPTVEMPTDKTSDDLLAPLYRKLQTDKIAELKAYFAAHNNPVKRIHYNHLGAAFLHLTFCPRKVPEDREGDPCAVVMTDGSHTFSCRHGKCAGRNWSDVEALYGPLRPPPPTIELGADLGRVVDETIAALRIAPVHQRGGVLVDVGLGSPIPRLCKQPSPGPMFRVVPSATLAVTLARVATLKKYDARAKGYVHCLPPEYLLRAVLASPAYPGIATATGMGYGPALRGDGSIAANPGYDEATGLYLAMDGPYPALPTVPDAVALLTGVVADFPFALPAHRSAWITTLVTLAARPAFGGPAPFNLFDANRSRVGKTKLVDAIVSIATGRVAARYAALADKDEMRKLITSTAMAGAPYLFLDNCTGKLGGPSLEAALTGEQWEDRLLGVNRKVSVPLTFVWLASSNNASLASDMVGRTLRNRLDTDCERPALRNDFVHPDLLGYVLSRRRELLMAALAIPAAYIAAGRPDQHLPAWGGFQEWSDLIRNSVVWAGLPDPDTRAEMVDDVDDGSAMLRAIMAGWDELGEPATASQAVDLVRSTSDDKYPALREAIAELQGDPKRALGTLLRDCRGRVLGGRRFVKTTHSVPKWRLENVP